MAQPPMFYQRSPDYESNMRMAQQLMAQGGSTAPVSSPLEAIARVVQGGVGGYLQNRERSRDEARQKEYSAVLAQALQASEPWKNPDTSALPSMNAMERDATMGGDGRRYLAPGEVAQGTGGQRAMIAALMGNEMTAPLGTQLQFQDIQNRQETERLLAVERAKQADKPPTIQEFFDEQGRPRKSQWNAGTQSWEPIGGAKADAPRNVQTVTLADGVFVVNPDGSRGRKIGDAPQSNRVTAPTGYRFTSDGVSLEAIPGGPADKRGERPAAPSGYAYTDDGTLQPIPGGPADKGGQREAEIKRYEKDYGLSREKAQGVVDGVFKLSDNQQTGLLTLTNVVTGQSEVIQPSFPQVERGPLAKVATDTYDLPAIGQLYDGGAVGPEAAAAYAWNRTIALTDKENLTVERQEAAIRQLAFVRESIVEALLKSDRGASAEQERLLGLLPEPGAFWSNQKIAAKNLTEVWNILARRRDRYASDLESPRLTRETREEADRAIRRIDGVLYELGIPPDVARANGLMPDAASANTSPAPEGIDPKVWAKLTPEEQALWRN